MFIFYKYLFFHQFSVENYTLDAAKQTWKTSEGNKSEFWNNPKIQLFFLRWFSIWNNDQHYKLEHKHIDWTQTVINKLVFVSSSALIILVHRASSVLPTSPSLPPSRQTSLNWVTAAAVPTIVLRWLARRVFQPTHVIVCAEWFWCSVMTRSGNTVSNTRPRDLVPPSC